MPDQSGRVPCAYHLIETPDGWQWACTCGAHGPIQYRSADVSHQQWAHHRDEAAPARTPSPEAPHAP